MVIGTLKVFKKGKTRDVPHTAHGRDGALLSLLGKQFAHNAQPQTL